MATSEVVVRVQVPTDKVPAFYEMVAAWLVGTGVLATTGPAGTTLTEIHTHVPTARLVDFYSTFAVWLVRATLPPAPAPRLTRPEATDLWHSLKRPLPKELLLLLSDVDGRTVPWSEISETLGLPATPSLDRDMPDLVAWCAKQGCSNPVELSGEGAAAAARLDPDLWGLFTALARIEQFS